MVRLSVVKETKHFLHYTASVISNARATATYEAAEPRRSFRERPLVNESPVFRLFHSSNG